MFKIKYTKIKRPEYKYGRLVFSAGGTEYVIHKCFDGDRYHVGMKGAFVNPENYVVYSDEELDKKFKDNVWKLIRM